MGEVDVHFVSRPLLWLETECGDIGVIRRDGDCCFLGLVDALGHGRSAFEVACHARAYLEEHFRDELVDQMRGLHEHLRGGKGAVAALCRINISSGELSYVGIGNIVVKILVHRPSTFVPRDGVLGFRLPSPVVQRSRLLPGDILVMHSDGIREHFNPLDCVDLLAGSAEAISKGILERFSKKDDDAACIALKYQT